MCMCCRRCGKRFFYSRKIRRSLPYHTLFSCGDSPKKNFEVIVGIPGGSPHTSGDSGYLSWLAGLTKPASIPGVPSSSDGDGGGGGIGGLGFSVLLIDPAGSGRSTSLVSQRQQAEGGRGHSAAAGGRGHSATLENGAAAGGRGHSADHAAAWVRQQVDDIRAVLTYWRGGERCGHSVGAAVAQGSHAERVFLVGHSVGAAVAQGYLQR